MLELFELAGIGSVLAIDLGKEAVDRRGTYVGPSTDRMFFRKSSSIRRRLQVFELHRLLGQVDDTIKETGASSPPALSLLGWLDARRSRILLVCFGPAGSIVHCPPGGKFWRRPVESRQPAQRNADARARAQSGRCRR